MKRYLVFAGSVYYPCGGWQDFVGFYATLEEARAEAAKRSQSSFAWSHVVDTETEEEI
jgi:hypothetical protein